MIVYLKKKFVVHNDEQLEIVKLDFKNKNPNFIISIDEKERIISFVKGTGIPYKILPYDNWKDWKDQYHKLF